MVYIDLCIDLIGIVLNGKFVMFVMVFGGNYVFGLFKEGWDYLIGWLCCVFEDVWGFDLWVV